jgi:hypothetical protein
MELPELTAAELEIQYLSAGCRVKEDHTLYRAAFAAPDIAVAERCRTNV